MLESKAFAVLTIKLVQRKVKVGINKDMYCTVLLIGRFLMDYFTKGMSPFCSGILFLDSCFSFLLVADFYIFMHELLYMDRTAINFS